MDEITVETTVMQAEPRDTVLKVMIYNKSAFPARALTNGSFRYYFRPRGHRRGPGHPRLHAGLPVADRPPSSTPATSGTSR